MSETVTTIAGDMWNIIAKRQYGSEAGMNVLMQANPAYIDTVVFPAGVTITVPDYETPITSVLPPWKRS